MSKFHATNSYGPIGMPTDAHDRVNLEVLAKLEEIWTYDGNDTSPPKHQVKLLGYVWCEIMEWKMSWMV